MKEWELAALVIGAVLLFLYVEDQAAPAVGSTSSMGVPPSSSKPAVSASIHIGGLRLDGSYF